MVNALALWLRMFNFPMPKYIELAPAFKAAAKLSRLPTGAIISKSERFMGAKLLLFFCISTTSAPHLSL